MYKRGSVWWTKIRHKGKIIQKSLETSEKKLAQAIEAKIRTEIVEGKHFDKPKGDHITVKALIGKYLEDHSKPNKKKRSHQEDIYLSKKILKYFGSMLLTEVSPKHISAFIKKRRNDGLSDTTIRHELVLLKHAYNLAITEWELIKVTPFTKKSIPKSDEGRIRYLSDDEEVRLLKVLPPWLIPIVTIARETGLRLSNIANLTWSQANLFSKIITIENTKNGDPLGLPMTDNVFETLKKLNKVRLIDSDFIFCNSKTRKPLTFWWIGKSFSRAPRH